MHEKLTDLGKCETCPDYQKASLDGKSCTSVTCAEQSILLTSG